MHTCMMTRNHTHTITKALITGKGKEFYELPHIDTTNTHVYLPTYIHMTMATHVCLFPDTHLHTERGTQTEVQDPFPERLA